jgi:hypothetical protein
MAPDSKGGKFVQSDTGDGDYRIELMINVGRAAIKGEQAACQSGMY